MSESVNLREVVLDILLEVNEKGAYCHLVLNQALTKFQYLDKNERAFITRLSQGTIEKMMYLDYVVEQYSKVSIPRMKPLIRNLLRMSVYQLLFMDGVPESAVCNEAVKLAQKRGFTTLKAFVNGVLRNIARNQKQWKNPMEAVQEEDEIKRISIAYSVPEWILAKWDRMYGRERLLGILDAFEGEHVTYVRCNTQNASEEMILNSLREQNVLAERVEGMPKTLKLLDYNYLMGLRAFQKGLIHVQDLSSMLAGVAAAPGRGDYVIDVCAAPGGKSVHAALMMEGSGMVSSRDISENKVFAMQDTIRRMGLSNMKAEVCDARVLWEEDIQKADIVLADLPCSGLGIIGRKADIKYKMTPEKQKELVSLQREILGVVSQYVKPGGKMVFSTCTINREENEENFRWIQETLGFTPVDFEKLLPESIVGDEASRNTAKEGYLQLLPGVHETDGFFISCLKKEK